MYNIKKNIYTSANSRDFYKGRSFRCTEWKEGVHYQCDEYIIDFVYKENVLYICTKNHLSDKNNAPVYSKVSETNDYWKKVIGANAQIVYLNAYFTEVDEDYYQYDHGDVTKAKLDEIINAGNIPYLNVYGRYSEDEEYEYFGVSVFDGIIDSIYSFRTGYQLIYDLSIAFWEDDRIEGHLEGHISTMISLLTNFFNNTLDEAIPSNDAIDALFNE